VWVGAYETEARVEGLCEDRVRGVQDQFGKEYFILALVYLWLLVLEYEVKCDSEAWHTMNLHILVICKLCGGFAGTELYVHWKQSQESGRRCYGRWQR
jgi:hypothetical protein